MLIVKPEKRISVKQLLKLPMLQKYGEMFGLFSNMKTLESEGTYDARGDKTVASRSELLKTIYSRRSLSQIQEQLPKARLAMTNKTEMKKYTKQRADPRSF